MPLAKNVIVDIRRQKRSVWILVAVVIVILGALLCMRCFIDYRQEVRQLEERLTAQSKVVDENITANLYAINLTLENIRQELNEKNSDLTNYLRMQNKFSPGIRSIVVTDSQGRSIHSNRDELIGQDLSLRDYFITPRDASDKRQTFMSPPFKTVLGAFVINITKAILGKNGEFKGVVSISLDPHYFLTLLKSTIYAPDYRIGLVHTDGTVFISIPEGSTSVTGKMLLKSGTLFNRHVQSGKPSSIQSGRSSTTADNRVFAYLNNNPKDLNLDKQLVIAASRNLDEALLHWKIITAAQFSLYLLLTLLLVGITRKMSLRGDELSRLHITQMSILESVGEGILGIDHSGTILFCNRAAGQLTGMQSNELVGYNFHQILHSDASGHDSAKCPINLTLKDGISRSVNNCAFAHLENVEHTVSPLIEYNDVVGAVIVFRDVTEKLRIERELRHALETAESANVTLSRLMSVVAHEFRTPLSLLTSSTDIIDRYTERLSKEQVVDQNAIIRSAARQMSCLIDSILSFNRQETDSLSDMEEPLDIGRMSHSIAEEVALVWAAGHDFQVTIPEDCGTVLLHKMFFRRILENLLTNAFRYTPTGKAVSLGITREYNRLQIVVADSGIGIPDDDKKRIFDAFYRCQNVESRRGLGLGLSIVNEALLQLGGSITVESAIGAGTTMRVVIPLIPIPNQSAIMVGSSSAPGRTGQHAPAPQSSPP